jgi:2,3-bisphosphoglycerate-independent phosphoglycerate mutase
MKTVFLLIDGMADLPINGKTPLSVAEKPNLDWLASRGYVGELAVVPTSLWKKYEVMGSHTLNIALLGYDPKKFDMARGPLEAIGADIPYKQGHLALRCNFATVDKQLTVIDRRSGRNFYGLDEITRYINGHVDIGVEYNFMRTYEHRAVLVLKHDLSDKISSNDPHTEGKKIAKISATAPDALISAKLVQDFVEQTHSLIEYHPKNAERIEKGIPPANYLLVRQPGNRIIELSPKFTKKWKAKACVLAEKGAVKATCMLAGFDAVTVPEAEFEKTLDFIFEKIGDLLSEYQLVYVHVKGPIDEAAHDGKFEEKVKGIEAVDRKLEVFKSFKGVLVVTCDHITSTELRRHMPGKVPLLVYGKGKDRIKTFDEFSVKKGKLKDFTPNKLWKYVFKG